MRYVLHFCFLILVAICTSCNYDPSGEFEVDIAQIEPPEALITVNENDSVLEIGCVTYCYYNFSPDRPLDIYQISVFLDGTEIPLNNEEYFVIDPAYYSFGEHTLTIEVITSSNSGSLADRVNAEGYIYNHELKVYIENRPPSEDQRPDILSLENINGTFRITWQQYPVINFEKYVLYRLKEKLENGTEYYEIAAEILDRTQNYFNDSSYIGGFTKYYVEVYASGHFTTGTSGETNFPLPQLLTSYTQGKNLVINFTKCLFPANFKQYQFYWSYDYNWDWDAGNTGEINDTSIMLSGIGFGAPIILKIATHSIKSDFTYDKRYEPYTSQVTHLGESFFEYDDIASAYPCDTIYFIKDRLYQYSVQDNQITGSIPTDGCSGAECYKIGISSNGRVLVLNNRELSKLVKFKLPELEETDQLVGYTNGNDLTISDEGIIPVASYNEFKVYDFKAAIYTDTLFSSIYGGFYGGQSYISSDGLTIYTDSYGMIDSVYRNTEGDYSSIPVNGDPFTTFVDYNPFNPDEIVYYSNKTIYIADKISLIIKRSFTVSGEPVSNIDPVTGLFLVVADSFNSPEKVDIYDLNEGEKSGEMIGYPNIRFQIFNGTLYSYMGVKLNLRAP